MPKICPHRLLYLRIKAGKIKVNNSSPELHRFWAKVDKNGYLHPAIGRCWEWTGSLVGGGYGSFKYSCGQYAHRYSWELYYGKIVESLWVLHKCDNRSCINPKHLFLGTHQDNMDDMTEKRHSTYGERSCTAKLTEKEVIQIFEIYNRCNGKYGIQKQLALQFGVTPEMIYNILRGRNWTYLNLKCCKPYQKSRK